MKSTISPGKNKKSRRGYALLIVLMLAPLFFMLTATIVDRVRIDLNFTNKDRIMKQTYYIAEAGEVAAFHELSAVNFTAYTHNSAGSAITGADRLPTSLPNTTIDGDGWSLWQWNPGDTHKSFTDTGMPEKFRYRVLPYETGKWQIDVEGYYGDYKRVIQIKGSTDTAFQYALFANDVLSEFTRGANQTITGRVHSNGNMFFRPDGSTLEIYSVKVSAAGDMVRYQDAWGRPDSGGTVKIQNSSGTLVTMDGKSQGKVGIGNAYDSFNSNWLKTDSSGAMSKWSGRVVDGSLGGSRQDAPPVESMLPGGFYEENAGLVVNSTTIASGITNASFYNKAEKRQENVKNLDMSVIPYPAGGLIYSNVPVRLVNASKLPGKLTVVSCCNIYTKGDVNKVYATAADKTAGNVTKVPMALMTTARIYHLSSGWVDSANTSSSGVKTATDGKLYATDEDNLVEVNSALVDGAPQVDEINYVKEWNGVTNSLYTGVDNSSTYCWANSDDLLENWSGKTLRKRGSIVHMENAVMSSFNNSDQGPGVTAWTYKTHYNPPTRDFGYDNDFSNPTKQPPFFPLVSKRLMWTLVK